MMDRLPPLHSQQWLLENLGALVSRMGHETLLQAPIIEPSNRFFPDPWQPNASGIRTLSRRLLAYAGLGSLDVDVVLYTNEQRVHEFNAHGGAQSWGHEGAAAWFAGIDGNVCRLGADTGQLQRPESIVAVVAHEVAHAWRAWHRLAIDDRDTEEILTDLTTIYLGFGILTVNNTYRYRTSGEISGGLAVSQWSTSRGGYLSPQAMSFLLGAQVIARRFNWRERWRLRGQLEKNQAVFFEASCQVLTRGRLLAHMDLPPSLLPPFPLPEVAPLPETGRCPTADETSEQPSTNAGQAVFRVRHTASGTWGFLAGLAAVLLVFFLPDVPTGLGFVAVPAAAVVGVLLGRRRRKDYCSDPSCTAAQSSKVVICPGCGGYIAGTIDHIDDRLEAEEALHGRSADAASR